MSFIARATLQARPGVENATLILRDRQQLNLGLVSLLYIVHREIQRKEGEAQEWSVKLATTIEQPIVETTTLSSHASFNRKLRMASSFWKSGRTSATHPPGSERARQLAALKRAQRDLVLHVLLVAYIGFGGACICGFIGAWSIMGKFFNQPWKVCVKRLSFPRSNRANHVVTAARYSSRCLSGGFTHQDF